jgi:hypothetical protein
LSGRAGASAKQLQGELVPNDTLRQPLRDRDKEVRRRVEGWSGMTGTGQAAKDIMDMRASRLIYWAAGARSAIRMANNCGRERVGSDETSGPARRDWCKNLHHQSQ